MKDVKITLEELLLEEKDAYTSIWDGLILNQRNLYSTNFLRKYRIKRASNLKIVR